MNEIKHNELRNSQQKAGVKLLAIWTLAWVVSTAFLRFGAEYIWDYQLAYSAIALMTHLAIGIMMILVNVKHLANLDELQRKVTMDAMGITLGVGLIAGIAYEQLEDIKLITFEPEIGHLIMLMGITYIISILIGNGKYK
ncbi:MAG: hypothetical protein ABJK37_14330 [Paraglaciecola sp.]|uniref:hypothetical protein n=1 Tax=Paraglaciecola sp. TaxID=1920173 RepID=UPI0032981A37